MTPGGAVPAPGDEERERAAEEIATRLRRRGVRLSGQESGEELLGVLDAIERFEATVQRSGGDLMMDEPTGGGGDTPLAPDNNAFVLPTRSGAESVADFIDRIAAATVRAQEARRRS